MEIEARRRLVRRVALACAVLVFAVTSLSAFVRLSNTAAATAAAAPGAAEIAATGPVAADPALAVVESEAVLMARGAHRLAASTTLLVVIALIALSLGPRPYLRREGLLSLGMFALVVFLAVLGRWSSGAVGPAVTLGNLLGGFFLFALCWRLAWPEPPAAAGQLRPLALLTALVLSAQVALGALSHPAHPWGAIVVAPLVVALAVRAWHAGWRAAAAGLGTLLVVQLVIGLGHTAAGSPPLFVLVHNMAALLLFATTLRMVGKPGKLGSETGFARKTRL
jgi:heme a synthase